MHIVILGRNKSAAQAIIAAFPSGVTGDFVYCDASLMRNVRTAARQVSELKGVDKVNWLAMTAGKPSMEKEERNEEGIFPNQGPVIYSRQRLAEDIAPLLQHAADLGEPARAFTVGGLTNVGTEVTVERLKESDFSIMSSMNGFPGFLCTSLDSISVVSHLSSYSLYLLTNS